MSGKRRVCIIGAGPSGTAMLRAFQAAQKKGVEIPDVTCYEKQATMGGLWNFSVHTGLGPSGEPVHNSMYRHLWSNGPKECLEFADYTFEEHFGHPIPSFPPREVLMDYIAGRAKKAGVEGLVTYNTVVSDCSFDDGTSLFTVRTRNLLTGSEAEAQFEHVVCCSGHFSTPNVPEFEGCGSFTGRLMHAHDFRSAEEFAGQDVLVIGSSYSAEDIASQMYKYGVKSVTLSWRSAPMGFSWPETFRTVPLLQRIEGRTCTFKDGSTAQVDAIILCTGYKHHFPFMRPDLRLSTSNRLCTDSLYEGVAWMPNPRLFYLGMQDQWLTFNMFDAQAWYVRDLILGDLALPGADVMAAEFAEDRKAEEAIEATDEANIRFQCEYTRRLIAKTDYPSFDMDHVIKEFLEWEHNKHENIMTFRDKVHRSAMTGTVAPAHPTPWLEERNDSLKHYVSGHRSAL